MSNTERGSEELQGLTREHVDFHVVCDGCESEWDSVSEWLDRDPCMPERGSDDD